MRLVGTQEVLVEREVVEKKSAGGIYIPDSKHDSMQQAAVISKIIDMTDDLKNDNEELLKVGNRVIAPRYFGTKVFLDDHRDLYILKRGNILAVLDDNEGASLNV